MEGAYSWRDEETAFAAALKIIVALASEVEIKNGCNVRSARFLLKPPRYGFDSDAFLKQLKAGRSIELKQE